ncbi:hypothetical protein LRAMOSA02571 [Lichtheimia ramosa]|uniref:SH3 domain-containing protein n=1 Tax=Lichtheimia ramosa TaxID=688394 RepID=A0A077WRP3_9FUNG|nr:hypothetical protein LRAMOSA02571 [Lichtheimia ramosa]
MKKVKNAASSISLNSPIPTSLAGECKKAARILNSFIDPGQKLVDKVIPPNILDNAQGLAIFTVLKAGFLFSGRAGSGLVVARLPDKSWSAPSAIVTGGIGAGGQIGAELTDFVLVLNTKEAVKTFSQFGNITLGGNVSLAAGPMGRNAEASGSASLKHIAAVYSYSKTKGLFAGVSLEGSVIATRNDANEKLYGQRVTAKELLNGTIAPPPEADMLYRALNARFHTLGNTGAMYARNSAEGSPRAYNFKSSNISAPGTIRQPPPLRNPPSAPPPTSSYNNQPPPPYTAPPPSNNNNNNYYGQEKSHYQQPPQPTSYGAPPSVATSRAPPPPPPAPIRKPQQPTARALYDFNGEQDGDLSFREGDVITIVEKSDSQDDWWTGSVGGRQGIFPANYVQLQ